MKFGNRKSLEGIPRKTQDVEIKEVDTFYRLREMSGTERDLFEMSIFKPVAPTGSNGSGTVTPVGIAQKEVQTLHLRAKLVCLCLVGEDGERLYEHDEFRELSDNVSSSVIATLFAAAQKLNGMEATAVEDAVKNSASGLQDDSLSGSPENSEKLSLNS